MGPTIVEKNKSIKNIISLRCSSPVVFLMCTCASNLIDATVLYSCTELVFARAYLSYADVIYHKLNERATLPRNSLNTLQWILSSSPLWNQNWLKLKLENFWKDWKMLARQNFKSLLLLISGVFRHICGQLPQHRRVRFTRHQGWNFACPSPLPLSKDVFYVSHDKFSKKKSNLF